MESQKRRVLYLSRYYQPCRTAAAIRCNRFIQALLKAGYQVHLITEAANLIPSDPHSDLQIHPITPKGRILTGNWILPGPDPEPAFCRTTYRLAAKVISDSSPDVLVVSSPPFGLMATGCLLSKRYNIPMVADFRDAWFTGMPWPYTNGIRKYAAKYCERKCLLHAKAVTVSTQTLKKILAQKYGPSISNKITVLRHGFSRERLVPASASPPQSDTNQNDFTIIYTGQLRGIDIINEKESPCSPWRKTKKIVRRLIGGQGCQSLHLEWMSGRNLLRAVAKAGQKNADFKQVVKIKFFGQRFPEIDDWAKDLNIQNNLRQYGPVSHERAERELQQATVLLLSLYGIRDSTYHWCVPSKTYTYLATGKPILGVVPPGETADLIQQAGTGYIAHPEDIEEITNQLLNLFSLFQQGTEIARPNQTFIQQFDSRLQTQQFLHAIHAALE